MRPPRCAARRPKREWEGLNRMPNQTTVRTLIAEGDAARAAIAAPGVAPLSRGRLLQQIDATVGALRALGIKANDRVAIVLPNGPEMAVSFLAVASGATA